MTLAEIRDSIRSNPLHAFSFRAPITNIEKEFTLRFVNEWEIISLRSARLIAGRLRTYIRTESGVYFARFAHNGLPEEARCSTN